MSSLQETEICGLAYPSTIASSKLFSYVVLKNMTILLIVMTTFPSIVILVVVVSMIVSPCRVIGHPRRL